MYDIKDNQNKPFISITAFFILLVEISIRDTDVGISKNIIDRFFKVGEKIGSKGTDGELSSGLGLLLCKEFVEKHDGRIWVESRENIGSTFYVTIPKNK